MRARLHTINTILHSMSIESLYMHARVDRSHVLLATTLGRREGAKLLREYDGPYDRHDHHIRPESEIVIAMKKLSHEYFVTHSRIDADLQ